MVAYGRPGTSPQWVCVVCVVAVGCCWLVLAGAGFTAGVVAVRRAGFAVAAAG